MFRAGPKHRDAPRIPTRRALVATSIVLVCAAGLLAGPASAAPADRGKDGLARVGALPVLRGTVGPGSKITFSEDTITVGRYKVIVRDRGADHNFHLYDHALDKATSVPGTGRTVWRVRFNEGWYAIQCDEHPGDENLQVWVIP